MKDETLQALEDAMNIELEHASIMAMGSEERSQTLRDANSLADRVIDIKKLELEQKQKEIENNLSAQKESREHKDAMIKNLATIGLGILSVATTIWGTIVTLNFERDGGIVTTAPGKSVLKSLLNFGKKG